MIRIKDKVILGIAAGTLANIIVSVIDIIFYKLNVNKYIHFHIAASAYFLESDVHTLPALIVGIISDFTIAAFLGILIVYILFVTGTDYFYLKGLIVVLVFWLFIYGIILRLKIARIDPIDAGTNLVHLSTHIMLGLITSWFIKKHGIPANKNT
ncbi:MAG: hypothetical protein GX434_17890 [Peptococcaceae bacterium]|nr:hypothetical protein [Peptococcaceae bacterium]